MSKKEKRFFSELSRSRPEICPERVATGLRGQRTGYTGYREQIVVPQTNGEFMEKLFYFRQMYEASAGSKRDYYLERARLWFQGVDNFPKVQPTRMDERVFSQILQQLNRQGIKALVLSYPDLPNKRLQKLVGQMGGNFRFLNLHSVVVEASKQTPLFDLLEDDFIHFTERGHQIAAEVISQALLNFATRKP